MLNVLSSIPQNKQCLKLKFQALRSVPSQEKFGKTPEEGNGKSQPPLSKKASITFSFFKSLTILPIFFDYILYRLEFYLTFNNLIEYISQKVGTCKFS